VEGGQIHGGRVTRRLDVVEVGRMYGRGAPQRLDSVDGGQIHGGCTPSFESSTGALFFEGQRGELLPT
jgi:hypothetical protein